LGDPGLHFIAPSDTWRLSDEPKAERVELPQHVLDAMQGLGPKQRKYFMTGDEPWIYRDNQRRGMRAQDRDKLPPNTQSMISSVKTMVSVYFSCCDFVSVEFLPTGQKYDSHFFTETVSPNIEIKFAECHPKLRAIAATCLLTTPHGTPPKCPLKRLKNWVSF
jgi:hypothetical protein